MEPGGEHRLEAGAALLERIDGVLDGGRCPGGLPSTVVALDGEAPRLVRAGAVAWDEVLGVLRSSLPSRGG